MTISEVKLTTPGETYVNLFNSNMNAAKKLNLHGPSIMSMDNNTDQTDLTKNLNHTKIFNA